jgi:hypothetical protein
MSLNQRIHAQQFWSFKAHIQGGVCIGTLSPVNPLSLALAKYHVSFLPKQVTLPVLSGCRVLCPSPVGSSMGPDRLDDLLSSIRSPADI